MRRLLAAIALSLIAPVAFAAKPTDAQIDRLFEVTRQQAMLENVLSQMDGLQRNMIAEMTKGQPLTAEQQAKMERVFALSQQHVREALTWEKLAPKFRTLYAETFEAEDLDALIAFYSSPAGQHYLDKMTVLLQKTMGLMQEITVPMAEKMREELAKEFSQMSDTAK